MITAPELDKASRPEPKAADRLTRKDFTGCSLRITASWHRFGGEAGARADFSGKNLEFADLVDARLPGRFPSQDHFEGSGSDACGFAGATLVQANLAEANLLGTQLQQANLQAADMHGATGLLSPQLAGTNLFGAILPESISPFEGLKLVREVAIKGRMAHGSDVAAGWAGVAENFHYARCATCEEFVGVCRFPDCRPLCRSFPFIFSARW